MANYTPTFSKPYPSGWVDKPSKTTPATAAIMNSYDTAIAALEAYLRDNAIDTVTVSVEQFPSDGRQWLGTITVGSNQYKIYMPSLKYENLVSDGIKIGTITLGEQSFDVYAPASSTEGSTVSVVPKTLTGTNIAEITVDGTTYQLYAPTGGSGSGSTVTAEALLAEGTAIGKITIDGVETTLYAPKTASVTVDAELSSDSENPIQNKAVDAAVKNLQKQIDTGGSGGSVTVDDALSSTSENPVQNKVITEELADKIETADTEESPDFVNFDLDVELSETSTKGVQNKAIAKEFKAYADGTKAVAKATAADAATKASQDGEGNNIADTYAKKTELCSVEDLSDAVEWYPVIYAKSDFSVSEKYPDEIYMDTCCKNGNMIYGQFSANVNVNTKTKINDTKIYILKVPNEIFTINRSWQHVLCGYAELTDDNESVINWKQDSNEEDNYIRVTAPVYAEKYDESHIIIYAKPLDHDKFYDLYLPSDPYYKLEGFFQFTVK